MRPSDRPFEVNACSLTVPAPDVPSGVGRSSSYDRGMSQPVDLPALAARIADHGPTAFLVTVNDDGTPHVVSAVVRTEDEALVLGAGQRTQANLTRRPKVTLLWPAGPDPAYSLIVDATYVADGEAAHDQTVGEVTLVPRAAVLHRVAGSLGEGPNCIPVGD